MTSVHNVKRFKIKKWVAMNPEGGNMTSKT
jgi:hypothetical protein